MSRQTRCKRKRKKRKYLLRNKGGWLERKLPDFQPSEAAERWFQSDR